MFTADSRHCSTSQYWLRLDKRLISASEDFETHSYPDALRLAAGGENLIDVKETA
jgi:hypothetical protein